MAQLFRVHPQNPERRLIKQAVAIIRGGGVVAYPTDSSYALGCRLGDPEAVKRIRALRGIDERHHLTLACRDLSEVGRFAQIDNRQFRILRRGTPGPFTFLLRATRDVPRRLQHPKRSTIGVRIPALIVTQALLEELGEPLLSTTLLLPGDEQPLNEPDEIRNRLERQVDAIIDAGACRRQPTTIVDLETDPALIVRRGRGDPADLGLVETT